MRYDIKWKKGITMPNTHSANTERKDERTKLLEANPCGICRASGLPTCKGHGGRGGSGGSSDSTEEMLAETITTLTLTPISLEEQLTRSAVWDKPDELELTFVLNGQDTLFTMKIDMENNQLIFECDKNLSKEQQADIRAYFEAIMKELTVFKTELIKQGVSVEHITAISNENTLRIRFPSAEHYDAFVQRLIDKNMIPMHPRPEPQKREDDPRVEEQASRYATPTPCDMNGPKPEK